MDLARSGAAALFATRPPADYESQVMDRESSVATQITPEQVESYLRRHGEPDAQVTALKPLGLTVQAGLKSYGYGRPLHVSFTAEGEDRQIVIRTMSPDPFGHNRRSARAEALLLDYDTFNDIPRHIRALDVGTFSPDGRMQSIATGEPFLVTNYVDGELYAEDLHALQEMSEPRQLDLDRVAALATYLADLHSEARDANVYKQMVRDTVGGGEGIFGLCDSYPDNCAAAPIARLRAIEEAAVGWRWKLRDRADRCRRTHGDFHPFNLLFREGIDFSVLDCSRGGGGEPADDLTCLSVNFLVFALTKRKDFDGPLRELWNTFWRTYLEASGDIGVLEVAAPFFAWRTLVLASPVWYPNIEDSARDRMLKFSERLLAGEELVPLEVDRLLRP